MGHHSYYYDHNLFQMMRDTRETRKKAPKPNRQMSQPGTTTQQEAPEVKPKSASQPHPSSSPQDKNKLKTPKPKKNPKTPLKTPPSQAPPKTLPNSQTPVQSSPNPQTNPPPPPPNPPKASAPTASLPTAGTTPIVASNLPAMEDIPNVNDPIIISRTEPMEEDDDMTDVSNASNNAAAAEPATPKEV